MKRIFTILISVLLTAGVFAQSPEKMSYQAVIRNSSNALVANTQIGMEINIRQGTPSGTVVYTETQTPTTNANGLVSIEIGDGAGFNTINWANGPYFIETKTAVAPPLTTYTITGTNQLLSIPYALYAKSADNGITIAQSTKLANIAEGAEVNIQADWNQATNTADDYIKNKPTIPIAQVQTDWTASSGMGVLLNKPANIDEDKTDDVNITGNQTIVGNKTFTGTTTVANPVNGTDAATKAYVDVLINQLSSKGVIVADIDGNIYSTVRIGSQVWMAENLRTTKYADGTTIPLVNTAAAWNALTITSKAYCWYNDDVANKATYGALYTWAAAMNGAASVTANPSGIQGVCPTGWHLPSYLEWIQLTSYLGGVYHLGVVSEVGGKLKETGTSHWVTPNTGATNETGFTALPGGSRDGNGQFFGTGYSGSWWNATEFTPGNAWDSIMVNEDSNVGYSDFPKEIGFSVRCLRD